LPRLFLYCERNKNLSSLLQLRESAIEVREMPAAGHFLRDENPMATYAIRTFVHLKPGAPRVIQGMVI
jgi:hypothetical protein